MTTRMAVIDDGPYKGTPEEEHAAQEVCNAMDSLEQRIINAKALGLKVGVELVQPDKNCEDRFLSVSVWKPLEEN